MKVISRIARFSRPAGTQKPFEFHDTRSISVIGKQVHLGNHAPSDHFAEAAHRFIPAAQLYDNRRRA